VSPEREVKTMPPPNLQQWPLPLHWGSGRERCGDWLFCPETRGPTTAIDLAAWPPRTVYLPDEFICSASLLPDGRWVVCSWAFSEGTSLQVRYHKPGDPGRRGPALDLAWEGRPYSPFGVYVVGHRVLLVSPWERDQPEGKPCELRGTGLVLREELPPAKYDDGFHGRHPGVLQRGGRTIFFWEGDGYEEKGGRYELTWPLRYRTSHLHWTSVPWGDGFFYLSDRRIMYARPGRCPQRCLPDADNSMYLHPGPPGSVLVYHGMNAKSLAARLWFPAEGSYVPIKGKDLGCKGRLRPDPLYWSEKTRHFYFLHGGLWTVPQGELLNWKHVRPKDPGPLFPLAAPTR
jgi:hypothetical protein